ncbi:hypothetical protein [Rhodococcus ruber]|uniref:Ferredoxin n=1 Tax=Rhodococcus ruber BKS 20-38 TaxID=1278076 RepID=M2YXP8_9NOCA|nr:hypothetical protein [Rhodococcus ruber]EME66765.1 hypothetical protein G352_02474 [Rhodococcus ruber BKS 20-38]
MQSLECHACGNKVLVAKYSPVHTSIQWIGPARDTCREFASAAIADEDTHYLPRCGALHESVDRAVRDGRLVPSRRVEPQPIESRPNEP